MTAALVVILGDSLEEDVCGGVGRIRRDVPVAANAFNFGDLYSIYEG